MEQCPKYVVNFPLENETSGTWPTESLSELEPLDEDSKCFLKFQLPPFTIVYHTFNISNISNGTLFYDSRLHGGNSLLRNHKRLSGTAVKQFISSNDVAIIISSLSQNDSAFSLSYNYHTAPTPTENISIGMGDYKQLNFNTRNTDESTKINSEDTKNFHTIVFLAYYDQDSWDYGSSDCLAFFDQREKLTSGNYIVGRDSGLWITNATEITMFYSPVPGFRSIIGFYGYKAPRNAQAQWPQYKAKAWEAKSYGMNSATEQIYVFMREDASNVGIISNITSKNDTDSVIEVYEGIAEVYQNEIVIGKLVARFNATTEAPTTLPGLTYTFYVVKGTVAFDLSEVPDQSLVASTTTENAPVSVTSPEPEKPVGKPGAGNLTIELAPKTDGYFLKISSLWGSLGFRIN
ncbi:unnamed protein product [Caenorhabditis auriculariae]|uniref:CUB-like domain-containing protein n=1 Tax=Caenorhabditis auriculariae TaxID=2777116 RepID=A0A8S1HQZ8_9PELO|nr:unnamed protein product [Caenorhabditis auriculariae]